MRSGRPKPDPGLVAVKILELAALTDEEYADALADSLVDPDPVEQAAFRSSLTVDDEGEPLAFRSRRAAGFLIAQVNTKINRRHDETGNEWKLRLEQFRNRVGMELRRLDTIVNGILAEQGRNLTQPNPRRRAERRLVDLAMQGDIPAGTWRRLVEEETAADKDRRAKEKAERRKTQAGRQR